MCLEGTRLRKFSKLKAPDRKTLDIDAVIGKISFDSIERHVAKEDEIFGLDAKHLQLVK